MAKSGMTWMQTAGALGVTVGAMSQWKTGRTHPRPRVLEKLAVAERAAGLVMPEDKPAVQTREAAMPAIRQRLESLEELVEKIRVEIRAIKKEVV